MGPSTVDHKWGWSLGSHYPFQLYYGLKMNSGRSRVNGATQTPVNTSKLMVQQMVRVKPSGHSLAGEREVEKDGRREEKVGVRVIRIHYI